jgi:hypothetical protein
MKKKKLLTAIAILSIVLLAGCKKDDFVGVVGVCPLVVSTSPINGALNVPLAEVITATFNEQMNPSTITDPSFIVLEGSTPVAGIVTYSGTTATFTPSSKLDPNTTFTGKITTSAKDMMGNAIQTDFVWTFSTGAIAYPTVISTDPFNLATFVSLNKVVAATFNMKMDPTTITATTVTLTQGTTTIAGTVAYVDSTVTFTPTTALTPNTVYTGTITTGAKNLLGYGLQNNYVWTFTTDASPTVISTDPSSNATGVALNKVVAATFSVLMNPVTITTTTFTVKQGTTLIAGTVAYNGSTATFTPTNPFTVNTVYTGTITTGAKNLQGTALASNHVWNFTTGSNIAPTVISTDPTSNATGVAVNKVIAATFSVPMDQTTITTSTFTLKQGTTAVSGAVSYSGSTASFTPSSNLLASTVYTATITTGAKNVAGTALAGNYVWSFTTANNANLPVLGSAANFGAFGGTAGITNQGLNTVINGAIATTAVSTKVTGFHDGLTGDVYTETPLNVGDVTGGIFTAPPAPGTATSQTIAQNALNDATIAYNSISPASKPGGIDPGNGELGGLTLAPGVYKSASGTFNISNGDLTLDAQGDPNAVWIFQTAAGLTVGIAGTAGARSVKMINGGLPQNVFWYVGSAATINGAGGGTMVGTIIAYSGVTFSTAGVAAQTVLNGRAISLIASVTMVNTTINIPTP